jgi:outer membrane protein OmpA-like peptidoglycan-associated protein
MLARSLALLVLVPGLALAAKPDAAGCKDHPLFTRMPGYFIYRCKEAQFEAQKFRVGEKHKIHDEKIEGRWSQTIYNFDKTGGATAPGRVQVTRNYRNAVESLGGEILYDEEGQVTARIRKEGLEYWVLAGEYGGAVTVTIVERKGMVQDVVANADAFASDLETKGHAAVYGIYFDTGQAVLKPESGAALSEIAKLLKAKPDLKVRLVGHTDSVGALDANLKLSQARAEAARAALTGQHGVAGPRLSAHGVGPLAPVATNATEEGRAKNRRVELVAW